jgi:alpha-L-arabinofuranosidase
MYAGYHVQKIFGQNAGDSYIAHHISLSGYNAAVRKGIAVSVVTQSETDDLILKMVNLLPVEVNMLIKLAGTGAVQLTATRTVLTGHPDDIDVRPVTDNIVVSNDFRQSLAAYSLTCIRIKQEL